MLNIYNPNSQNEQPLRPLPKKENGPKSDYHKYEDASGDFDNKELEYSLWWIRNKVLVYRITVFALLGINVLIWSFNIGKWGVYIFGLGEDKRMEIYSTRFYNYTLSQDHFKPKQLQTGTTNAFPGGVGKYDLVTEIQNPNHNFMAIIKYRYFLGVTSTGQFEGIVLAGDRSMLNILGLPEEQVAVGSVALQIENMGWKRISPHQVKDPPAWQEERLRFRIKDFTFQNSMATDGLKTNRIAFTLKNESAYAYKTPRFFVGLYSGDALIGVMPLQTEDFRSQEEKNIELRNFSSSLQPTEIKIFPQINLYDPAVYLSPGK